MSEPGSELSAREVLRPYRHLFSRGVLAIFALTTPIFAVVYWLTVPAGGWGVTLGIHLATIALALLALMAYFDTVIVLGPERIVERGFFGHVRMVPLTRVHDAIMVEVYQSDALDTTAQLFLCAPDGSRLLRMRGQFWSRTDMQTVLNHVDVPVHNENGPLTMSQMRQRWPRLLYWFERRPWPPLPRRTDRA